ncbi:MAG TPA: hypothetical protein VK324_13735, partial [Tepidisphaeraceae bacterium]|nr:hypothetical protein [Tepidisphaeraceae bacterium]
KAQLPFFLEEGIACLFEDVDWDGRLPRWDLSSNGTRLAGLRTAVEDRKLFPLSQLIRMHAGEVVRRPGERLGAFYAQNWAFARFLWDGEGGRYRPALLALTADAVAGSIRTRAGPLPATGPWDPHASRPILEHYLNLPLDDIEKRYAAYVARLAASGD